jgi:hypothetical protein
MTFAPIEQVRGDDPPTPLTLARERGLQRPVAPENSGKRDNGRPRFLPLDGRNVAIGGTASVKTIPQEAIQVMNLATLRQRRDQQAHFLARAFGLQHARARRPSTAIDRARPRTGS